MSQGAGRIQLFVPESWSIDADVDIDGGELTVYENGRLRDPPDRDNGGIDRRVILRGDPGAPTLDANFDLTVGVVEVHRES